MPPRYAYWTILVDNQPTAFRAGAKEDLLPTFNRLKEKNPSAVMMWFQNGKLWPSRVDAQEAMLARGEMGRRGDVRQGGGFRERHKVGAGKDRNGGANFSSPRGERRDRRERSEWSPKPQASSPQSPEKLDWKPKGTFTPAPKRSDRSDRPEWKPRGEAERTFRPKPQAPGPKSRGDWKPKSSFDRDRKAEWKPKSSFGRASKPAWNPRTSKPQNLKTSARGKLEWKPKNSETEGRGPRGSAEREGLPEKRKWIPKEEYKKSQGIEAKRDGKWRPGGEHRDPRQKYKDAKKAKWSKFKKNIRQKWESKTKKKP